MLKSEGSCHESHMFGVASAVVSAVMCWGGAAQTETGRDLESWLCPGLLLERYNFPIVG